MYREPKELLYPLFNTKYFYFLSHFSSFCLLLGIVLKFFEKCEGKYKLIFVKKEYLIDISKDKRS
jgi:hypothetical protein